MDIGLACVDIADIRPSPKTDILVSYFSLVCALENFTDLLLVSVDPRTVDGYWLRTPEPMMAVVLLYLVFVVVVPRLMENRPPMDLKPLIIAYNFILVGISGYMCLEVSDAVFTASHLMLICWHVFSVSALPLSVERLTGACKICTPQT